jgi:hypothetical protein
MFDYLAAYLTYTSHHSHTKTSQRPTTPKEHPPQEATSLVRTPTWNRTPTVSRSSEAISTGCREVPDHPPPIHRPNTQPVQPWSASRYTPATVVDDFAQSQIDANLTSLEHHFLANINAAWQKLNDYYTRTDHTPIYRLAVFLHPLWKWRWFERY